MGTATPATKVRWICIFFSSIGHNHISTIPTPRSPISSYLLFSSQSFFFSLYLLAFADVVQPALLPSEPAFHLPADEQRVRTWLDKLSVGRGTNTMAALEAALSYPNLTHVGARRQKSQMVLFSQSKPTPQAPPLFPDCTHRFC